MAAQDLRQALNILDPERSLRTKEELDDYFVERPLSPLEDLRIYLTSTSGDQKILFTGHRGSGKSTELAKLTLELRSDFFIVNYSVKSVLNLFDLTYVDVVLSLGLELVRRVIDEHVDVRQDVLAHILSFAQDITKDIEIGKATTAEVGGELGFLANKLSAKMGTEETTRLTIRQVVSHRISDLLESIQLLTKEIERVGGRRMLVIIEDLDKTDLETAKKLFYEHANALLNPPVSIIYTFPMALRHDNCFMQIQSNFPDPYVLPNIKTCSKDGHADDEGLARLRDIISKRVDPSLFGTDALLRLAVLSSGIPRELIALARRACLESMKANEPTVGLHAVERAAQARRRDYEVLLTAEQLRLLKKIKTTKRLDNDEGNRALLHNLSALEYRNGDVWYDVHPVVSPLLDTVQEEG
jgi:hypothetical protein